MKPSQLRLDEYYIDELRFSLDNKYENKGLDSDPRLKAEDLDVEVEPFRHPDNPLQWYFRLAVRLEDKEGRFPYKFLIRLTGFFEVTDDCKAEMIEPLALINAPSILYASAREILAGVSARSRFFSVFLPSLRFFAPTLENKVEIPESPKVLGKKQSVSKRAPKPVARKK